MRTSAVVIPILAALLIGAFGVVLADSPPDVSPDSASAIRYRSVAAALEDLRSKPGVEVSDQGGWTIVSDRSNSTLWSFAPPGNAAYPAVVKRTAVTSKGGVELKMDVLCEASKTACEKLVVNAEVKVDHP